MYSTLHSAIARIGHGGQVIRVACVLAAVFALSSVSGCALLSDSLEKAAKAAGKTVTEYCENVTVQEIRDQIAVAVNERAAPHKVEITCADEMPPVAPVQPATGDATDSPTAKTWNPILIIERYLRPIFIIEKSPPVNS